MQETNNVAPRIGAFVLETLTTGMYTNPLDTLREYVQNSFDAIREAERCNALLDGAGRIEIAIDAKSRTLTLRDNGMGIPVDQVNARLVNIGMSSKSIQSDAGFRGIGRLAGIAYCDRLVFTTQAKDERDCSSVTFDCRELRSAMSPQVKQIKELADVIGSHASVNQEKVGKKEHYCQVRMESINEAGQPFLDWTAIETYLSQVAPVGLDTQSFVHSSTIMHWLKSHKIVLPTVSIIINAGTTTRQVFKPYRKITYTTAQEKHKIDVKSIRFFPQEVDPNCPYWGWYAETNCPGIIGDDTVAGLRLRKANFGIGMADRMTEIFAGASESYARLNKYFMGEIHVQHPDVIPNARRDGFEDSREWAEIRKSLVEFARERSREVYQLSQARNLDLDRLLGAAEREKEAATKRTKTGLASKTEQERVVGRLVRQMAKLESANNAERSDHDRAEIHRMYKEVQKVRETIESETEYTAQRLNSALDKKQRKIISEIICVLYDVLDERSFEKAREAILNKYGMPDKEGEK